MFDQRQTCDREPDNIKLDPTTSSRVETD